MKKILMVMCVFALITSCDEEDDGNNTVQAPTTSSTNNQNDTSSFFNSYQFSDDGVTCFPLSNNIGISSLGILSVVSQPCSKPSSKLDGYFRPVDISYVGTYKVVGSIGAFPVVANMNPNECSMLFYNHGESVLYSIGGIVEVTKNATDSTLLDMNWKDITMGYEHDSTTITFSGNFTGI